MRLRLLAEIDRWFKEAEPLFFRAGLLAILAILFLGWIVHDIRELFP